MPREFRRRSRTLSIASGGQMRFERASDGYLFYTTYGTSRTLAAETCDDYVSTDRLIGNNLLLQKWSGRPIRLNGFIEVQGGVYVKRYTNYLWGSSGYQSTPLPPAVDWTDLKNKALTHLNPNVPPVDPLNFIFELKDLPRMLFDLGRVLRRDISPSDVPGGYLAYQFGWKPLVSDIKSLLTFGEDFDKRLGVLYRAGKKGRHRASLGSSTSSERVGTYAWEHGKVQRSKEVTRRSWYTALLSPTSGYPRLEHEFVSKFRDNYMFNHLPATVWNSLPWTWLIDYFSHIGSFLEASSGRLPYEVQQLSIMCQTVVRCTDTYSPSVSTLEPSTGYAQVTSKQRVCIMNPRPGIWFRPGLSKYQTGILGALGTANGLRSAKYR